MKKVKELLKTTKGKIIGGILLTSLIASGVVISMLPSSVGKLYKQFSVMSDVDNAAALEWLSKELDGKGLFGKMEEERKKEVIKMKIDEINAEFMSATGGTIEDYGNVKISKVETENQGRYSNYKDLNITIDNNSSKSIRYIKVNIYFKDSSGNIISSDWTNDTSNIKAGASQIIDKMIPKSGWSTVSCEIAEIKFN